MKLLELLNEWVVNKQQENIKKQTYYRYLSQINLHIIPSLGNFEIKEITRKQINEFISTKKHIGNLRYDKGLSAITINMILSILNMAFEYACDNDLIENNPCDKIKRMPQNKQQKIEAFTREEQRKIEKIIECEDDGRLYGIILCFYTGIRIGELLALKWTDLNKNCNILTISKTSYQGKNENGKWQIYESIPKTQNSYRYIPLPDHIQQKLKQKKDNTTYIVQNKKNKQMSIRTYQYIFKRITKKANVRQLNFHAIRHTFATRAIENGMDVKTLSEIMGHKDATITLNRYAHCMMETKIKMMKKMTKI